MQFSDYCESRRLNFILRLFFYLRDLRLVKLIVFNAIDTIFLLIFKYIEKMKNREDIENHVVIVRTDAIGDAVLWLDSYKAILKLFPESRLSLIGNKRWTDIFLNNEIDNIISIDEFKFNKNFFYRYYKLSKIGSINCTTLLNPTYSREFFLSDTIVRFVQAEQKIGIDGNLNNITKYEKKVSDKWYTKLIESNEKALMELERNAEFIRGIGLTNFIPSIPKWPLKIRSTSPINQQYYAIFPGSSREIKMWPAERFVELCERIYKNTGMIGVICGGLQEQEVSKRIVASCNAPLINKVARTTLESLANFIHYSQLIITNDSSAVHIATALNVKSICIVGGFHPNRFLPYPKTENKVTPVIIQKNGIVLGAIGTVCIKLPKKLPPLVLLK